MCLSRLASHSTLRILPSALTRLGAAVAPPRVAALFASESVYTREGVTDRRQLIPFGFHKPNTWLSDPAQVSFFVCRCVTCDSDRLACTGPQPSRSLCRLSRGEATAADVGARRLVHPSTQWLIDMDSLQEYDDIIVAS